MNPLLETKNGLQPMVIILLTPELMLSEGRALFETVLNGSRSNKVYFLLFFLLFGLGIAGDSLAYHNGSSFSTKDSDNTGYRYCSEYHKGAWWYDSCYNSNLNGIYHHHGHYTGSDGLRWDRWKFDSAKRTEMKIRPVNY